MLSINNNNFLPESLSEILFYFYKTDGQILKNVRDIPPSLSKRKS